ncbi:hypothetical protein BECAL_02931 [Bellilinea caldifistulae]|uniref:Xylose isomerase-like TIM barrel domain-containing protein n=1 Tax=Bellilinea caldifistulae TaxID=360411 RepID=A0A0N8GM77_9CHLR|nr:hypothetical protein [Bellilinea caldifistulae]KPL74530.1 hypothetical protein AC812_12090 [Bellilinea caldifistulae]GAP11738.1 hypothetical protein BECAL_02931 [Bellilinea caldifistulae]
MSNLKGLLLNESHSAINFKSLRDAGAEFVTIHIGGKSEDNKLAFINPSVFAGMVQKAYDAGLAIGVRYDLWVGYWLHNGYTMQDVDRMPNDKHPIVSQLVNLLRYKAVSFMSVGLYEMSLITGSGQVTDSWLGFALRDITDRLLMLQRAGVLLPFKLGVYSRADFVNANPSLESTIGARPELYIHAPKWIKLSTTAPTISELLNKYKVNVAAPAIFGWTSHRKKSLSYWDLGSQDVVIDGAATDIGVEYYLGDKEDFLTEIKPRLKPQEPAPKPEPTPAPEADTLKQILDELKAIRQILSERL